MANNQYVNKVDKADGTTIMDISDTTATENDVLSGKVFYKASGARSSGSVDLSTKADKVSGATSGNFAGLDSNGNLTDSGSKASDFLTSHQDISGKADKVTGATNGNFAGLDSNGNLTDSGHKHSDYLTSHQDISGKVNGASSSTNNNVVLFDGTTGKTIKDSGKTLGKSVPSDAVFTDTTYSAGTGLSLSGTTFSVKTGYTTSNKNYKVAADNSGNLYVNVPWTDHYAWSDITGKPNTAGTSGGTGLTLVTTGDRYNWDNNYVPLKTNKGIGSVTGGGSNNYFKLATIVITNAWADQPVTFELSQRHYDLHWLSVNFANDSASDPELLSFITNGHNQYWIKKTATSTWEIYGKYSEAYGEASLHRITGWGYNNKRTVTVNLTNAGTTAPGGTQAIYGWNAGYASSVPWAGVTGSPIVVETTNLTFSSGYVDISDKSGYYLANAYSCSRDEKNYGILFFVQRTNGSYRLYNNDASLSASLSVRRIWVKASS